MVTAVLSVVNIMVPNLPLLQLQALQHILFTYCFGLDAPISQTETEETRLAIILIITISTWPSCARQR